MKTAPVLFLLAFLAISSADAASAAWIIELNSGRTLEANSYRVEKGRVYLEYPVGEASIMLSQVKTIVRDSAEVSVFQKKGIREALDVQKEPYATSQPEQKASEAKNEKTGGNAIPPAENSTPGGGSTARSAPAASGQPELKPTLTPEKYQQLLSDSVEVKTPQQGAEYDPQVEGIINGLENADEAQRNDLEKKLNSLFDTYSQQNK